MEPRLLIYALVAADVRTDGEASAGGYNWHAQECHPLHPTHVLHHWERQVRRLAVFSGIWLGLDVTPHFFFAF